MEEEAAAEGTAQAAQETMSIRCALHLHDCSWPMKGAGTHACDVHEGKEKK